MADRTPRRRRATRTTSTSPRRGRPPAIAPDSAASKLMESLSQVLEENRILARANATLKATLAKIAGLSNVGDPQPEAPRTRARRTAPAEAPKAAATPRKRRPITDPVALERRRQALAKARAVRAEKLRARG